MNNSEPNKFDKPLASFHEKDGSFFSNSGETTESNKED